MDEIEIFDTPVANAGDMGALLLRFLFNSAVSYTHLRAHET